MDRDELIKRIVELTDYKEGDLTNKDDQELFNIYLCLEDMGFTINLND